MLQPVRFDESCGDFRKSCNVVLENHRRLGPSTCVGLLGNHAHDSSTPNRLASILMKCNRLRMIRRGGCYGVLYELQANRSAILKKKITNLRLIIHLVRHESRICIVTWSSYDLPLLCDEVPSPLGTPLFLWDTVEGALLLSSANNWANPLFGKGMQRFL